MSRLSIVREIKNKNYLKVNEEYERELKWDNRFYLGRIPNFEENIKGITIIHIRSQNSKRKN